MSTITWEENAAALAREYINTGIVGRDDGDEPVVWLTKAEVIAWITRLSHLAGQMTDGDARGLEPTADGWTRQLTRRAEVDDALRDLDA
jgi:hypothetical protein